MRIYFIEENLHIYILKITNNLFNGSYFQNKNSILIQKNYFAVGADSISAQIKFSKKDIFPEKQCKNP